MIDKVHGKHTAENIEYKSENRKDGKSFSQNVNGFADTLKNYVKLKNYIEIESVKDKPGKEKPVGQAKRKSVEKFLAEDDKDVKNITIPIEKEDVLLQLFNQIRNEIIEAYKEIIVRNQIELKRDGKCLNL
jgi:flagellar hook-basal body complex protein FliE